ncbi:hypothetical protein HW555_007659 [Spodoptera exigua]|uniref:Retrotransposon gag domain-containing protein n=1 Tax=Spodoptera exigua TaxID=7107 RepID=A0A835L2H2_SPOEX|nr:hypothetical protein HW555_007659 [Spodoptera exigua]
MLRQNIKKEHESLLISFVLKTRISRHAKLRLASNYDTSADLIKDMKNNLLTKQSATALQLELLQSRQGSQSIEEFGKKLEDLFVELTISQADGKEDAYKMFRPVNEKLAIQRFTEGLRNGRLSTILTARDYSELKDVIRAAKDEERAHQGHSTSAETVFAAQHRGRHRNRLRGIRYLLGLITEGAQEVLLTIREDVDYHQGVGGGREARRRSGLTFRGGGCMLMLVAGPSATETRDHEELADRCRHTDASPPSAAAERVRSPYETTPRMTRVHPYHDKRTIKVKLCTIEVLWGITASSPQTRRRRRLLTVLTEVIDFSIEILILSCSEIANPAVNCVTIQTKCLFQVLELLLLFIFCYPTPLSQRFSVVTIAILSIKGGNLGFLKNCVRYVSLR